MHPAPQPGATVPPAPSPALSLVGDGSPEAVLLRDAAEVARAAAAGRLEQRLPGVLGAFAPAAVGLETLSVLAVDPAFLDRLDAVAGVDRALRASDLGRGRGTIVRPDTHRGRDVDDAARTPRVGETTMVNVEPGAGLDRLRRGHTLVLNDVQDVLGGEAADLVRDTATTFRSLAQVNAYVSVGDAPGFGAHWDDHDVVIVQVAGRKLWEVRRPTEPGPVKHFTPPGGDGEVVWSGVLAEGTALAIPRGWPHQVTGIDGEVSVHLTLSNRRASGVDVVARTAPEQLLGGRPTPAAIDAALAAFRAEVVAWPDHGPVLLQQADAEAFAGWEVTAHMPGGVVFVEPAEDADRAGAPLRLRTGGRDLAVTREAATVLAHLLVHGWCAPEQAARVAGHTRDDVVATARALSRAGALGLRRER